MKNLMRQFFVLVSLSYMTLFCHSMHGQEIFWQKRYGGSDLDNVNSVIPTRDKGYLILSYSSSGISGDKTEPCFGEYDIWLLKFNRHDTLEWQKTIGGNKADSPVGAFQMEDDGYLILANSSSGISGNKTVASKGGDDYWLIKLDRLGKIEWQKSIGADSTDSPSVFIQTVDGNFIACGSSYSGISGDKTEKSRGRVDLWLVKIDKNANIIWDKTVGGNHDDVCSGGFALSDSSFTISATSISKVNGDKTVPLIGNDDIWVLNINSYGKIIYQKALGTAIADNGARAMVEVGDDIWVSGNIGNNSGAKPQFDPAIYLLDRKGTLKDSFIFEADKDDAISRISSTYNGGFFSSVVSKSGISGIKSDTSRGGRDLWLVRLDKNKKLLWDKTFGGNLDESAPSFIEYEPGHYLIFCTSSSRISGDIKVDGKGTNDILIIKLKDHTIPKCCFLRWWNKIFNG
ncbi:MAG: hypothetical protein KA251_01945 [Saprospiraceae bacterium]|nr:hypothetical protein [Candidatus Vicinibacter affinis]MBP6173992.1 hypothetical protein [Saprospiraceae bacterium]MBK6823447.1 hypothetical protein [Candidatus Vicinibacter affinis]MBK7302311.1 hypothetical protein [Candidatus Vicinibacter affinis]MBK7693437.1 hypothetical protein [Candidatus Vicinibacter affinis]